MQKIKTHSKICNSQCFNISQAQNLQPCQEVVIGMCGKQTLGACKASKYNRYRQFCCYCLEKSGETFGVMWQLCKSIPLTLSCSFSFEKNLGSQGPDRYSCFTLHLAPSLFLGNTYIFPGKWQALLERLTLTLQIFLQYIPLFSKA